MSNKQVARVWDMRGLPAHLKLPLLRLADHANSEGLCFPGQASLARDCDVSERSIRYALDHLDRLGLVEKVRRRRRSTQVYQLHLPDESEGVDWAHYTRRVADDPELRLGHGWFSQDRPQVAGQTSIDQIEASFVVDRQSTAGVAGSLTGSKTGSRLHQDRQPTSGKTGSPLPVPKGNPHRTPTKNRARAASDSEPDDQALRDLALELAIAKGARNPEGLARTILSEDHGELALELDRRRAVAAEEAARSECTRCDSSGLVDGDDGYTYRCSHQPVEVAR